MSRRSPTPSPPRAGSQGRRTIRGRLLPDDNPPCEGTGARHKDYDVRPRSTPPLTSHPHRFQHPTRPTHPPRDQEQQRRGHRRHGNHSPRQRERLPPQHQGTPLYPERGDERVEACEDVEGEPFREEDEEEEKPSQSFLYREVKSEPPALSNFPRHLLFAQGGTAWQGSRVTPIGKDEKILDSDSESEHEDEEDDNDLCPPTLAPSGKEFLKDTQVWHTPREKTEDSDCDSEEEEDEEQKSTEQQGLPFNLTPKTSKAPSQVPIDALFRRTEAASQTYKGFPKLREDGSADVDSDSSSDEDLAAKFAEAPRHWHNHFTSRNLSDSRNRGYKLVYRTIYSTHQLGPDCSDVEEENEDDLELMKYKTKEIYLDDHDDDDDDDDGSMVTCL